MTIATTLREWRQYRGLSQAALADGIATRHHVAKFETGVAVPNARILVSLCERMQCPLANLLDSYLEVQSDPEELSELALALSERGQLQQGFRIVKRLVRPAVSAADLTYLWARMLDGAAHPRAALPLFRRAIQSLKGDRLVEGLYRTAKCARKTGELVEAHRLYWAAQTQARSSRTISHSLMGNILTNLGNVEFALGSYSAASGHYLETLTLARASKDVELQISSLIGISACYLNQDRFEEALGLLEDCAVLCGAVEQSALLPQVYNNMAIAQRHLGKADEAVRLLHGSINIDQSLGLNRTVVYSLNELTGLSIDSGRLQEAAEYNQQALNLTQNLTDPREQALVHKLAAKIHTANHAWHDALSSVQRSLDSLGPLSGAQKGEMLCLAAEISFVSGRQDRALEYCREAARLFEMLQKEEARR